MPVKFDDLVGLTVAGLLLFSALVDPLVMFVLALAVVVVLLITRRPRRAPSAA